MVPLVQDLQKEIDRISHLPPEEQAKARASKEFQAKVQAVEGAAKEAQKQAEESGIEAGAPKMEGAYAQKDLRDFADSKPGGAATTAKDLTEEYARARTQGEKGIAEFRKKFGATDDKKWAQIEKGMQWRLAVEANGESIDEQTEGMPDGDLKTKARQEMKSMGIKEHGESQDHKAGFPTKIEITGHLSADGTLTATGSGKDDPTPNTGG
jgi:hypothetical protein